MGVVRMYNYIGVVNGWWCKRRGVRRYRFPRTITFPYLSTCISSFFAAAFLYGA